MTRKTVLKESVTYCCVPIKWKSFLVSNLETFLFDSSSCIAQKLTTFSFLLYSAKILNDETILSYSKYFLEKYNNTLRFVMVIRIEIVELILRRGFKHRLQLPKTHFTFSSFTSIPLQYG